jgi:hypothetical protein
MDIEDAVWAATHKIGRRLGTDVYGAFETQRNLIDFAIMGAIALALMKDYISGFVDLKHLGQSHRAALSGLIERIRADTVTLEDKVPSSIEADLAAARALAHDAQREERKAAAIRSLIASLGELGLSGAQADACASDISDLISKILDAPE